MLENKKAFNGKLCMWIGALYSQVIEATLYLLHQLIGTYKYAQNIGIEKHVTSHTMRHSHISLLSQLGVSLRAIMERVGHTDHKTTLQIYSHVTEQMDKDMMNKLEKIRS